MRTEREIREMLDKVDEFHRNTPWWDDSCERMRCIMDALLWVLKDNSGMPIDPSVWVCEYGQDEDVEERDYSPSAPWNAPGMSAKDFIR